MDHNNDLVLLFFLSGCATIFHTIYKRSLFGLKCAREIIEILFVLWISFTMQLFFAVYMIIIDKRFVFVLIIVWAGCVYLWYSWFWTSVRSQNFRLLALIFVGFHKRTFLFVPDMCLKFFFMLLTFWQLFLAGNKIINFLFI